MVRRLRRWTAACAVGALALLPGCLSGAIYTHVTEPLDVNFDETPVHTLHEEDSWRTFEYYVRVDWGSAGPGDIARRAGMRRIHYMDVETLTVLRIWRQRWVHVYGER